MVSNETKRIGLIIPMVSNEYWVRISDVIQDRLMEYGYNLILCCSRYSSEVEEQHLAILKEWGADGVIYSPASIPDADEKFFQRLDRYPIPVVILDRNTPGLPKVCADHFDGALKATEHLINLGHKSIAYLGGPLAMLDRELGFRFAHEKHDLSINDALIFRGNSSLDFVFSTIQDFIQHKPQISAVFCGNDMTAVETISALVRANIRVPEDIAVVGYGDYDIPPCFSYPLTSVKYPFQKMGETIVDLLLQMIQGKEKTPDIPEITFPAELMIRSSCGSLN